MFLCGDRRNQLCIAWVPWHSSIAWNPSVCQVRAPTWNPSVCQVRAPKSYFPQMCINSFDRWTVQWYSTLNSTTVPRRQNSHTSHMHAAHPTSHCSFSLLCFWAPSRLHYSLLLLSHFFDWPDSMFISMSHYLLEYSGECFQLLPLQLW